MKIEVLDCLEAVGPAAWQTLHAATALRSPFLTWTWQSEWARAFASDDRLEIGTVGLYNSGFHPARAALAPGLVLLAHVIRDVIARGKRWFDFLRGEERYKYEFGPSPQDVCTVTLR